ncbi:MAG TPA: DNA-protecting protein DprA [Chloroflexi bacterium]|nr:DNA-protecting protein DprA [Chloroflexota bacterium]
MSTAHWVALATTARVGGKTITCLLAHFGSLEAILSATPEELIRVPRVGPRTAAAIASIDLGATEAEIARLAEQDVRILTWEDAAYPPNLLRCDDAPPVLFLRGELAPAHSQAVAIVGTRQPEERAASLAYRMGYELARRGWTIVSGLAIGVDTAAHRGALAAGGRTLAVLGSGVLNVYPRRNRSLAGAIMGSGVVLAEVHPEAAVSPQNLIARNRITSGLSRAVIVVEAAEDSGSLSTARRARQQGRMVFTVTGGDAGCEELLAAGAEALDPETIDWDALAERLGSNGL